MGPSPCSRPCRQVLPASRRTSQTVRSGAYRAASSNTMSAGPNITFDSRSLRRNDGRRSRHAQQPPADPVQDMSRPVVGKCGIGARTLSS